MRRRKVGAGERVRVRVHRFARLGAPGRRGCGEQGARVGGASVRRDGRCERTVRVGGASGRCATDGASGRRELATREAADKQTAETAGEMMARGSEGATVGGGGGARAERRVGGGRLGRGGARVRAVGLRSTSELGAAAFGQGGGGRVGGGERGSRDGSHRRTHITSQEGCAARIQP